MGKIKNVATKVALGVAGVIGAAAAIGSAAKKEYKESKAAKEAENEKKAKEKEAQKVYDAKFTKANSKQTAAELRKEEIRRQRQNENRIYELSKTPQLTKSGMGGAIFLFLIFSGIFIGIMTGSLGDKFNVSILSIITALGVLFIAFLFIIIRGSNYKKRIDATKERIANLQHKLAFLRKEQENKNDNLYADLTNEIVIHQSALNNVAIKYNKYIKIFPNSIHTSFYAIEEFDPSEKEEKVSLKWTSK